MATMNDARDSLRRIVDDIQRTISNSTVVDLATLHSESEIQSKVDSLIRDKAHGLSNENRERIRNEFFGLGPLTSILHDSQITEILINSKESIWFERGGTLNRHSDCFLSQRTYLNAIHLLCRQSECQLTLDQPFAAGVWENFRVQIVGSPISKSPIVALRARSPSTRTLEHLFQERWCSATQLTSIQEMVHKKENFLVVGPTGSGKTTVLNCCLKYIPKNERVVLLEDTEELDVPNEASTKLVTRQDPQLVLREMDLNVLVRQSLRLRPDRLVIGEVRGAEAKELLMALATGHAGSMGTLHAGDAREAILRLEMLVQLGAPQWSQWAVQRLIQLTLHKVVLLKKAPCGTRHLEGIYRLASLEKFGFLMEKVA